MKRVTHARWPNIFSQLEASCVQTHVVEYARPKRLVKRKLLSVNRMSVGPLITSWIGGGGAHEPDGGRRSAN